MKPKVKLCGENGNVFNLLALCTKALKRDGQREQAAALTKAVFSAKDYDDALVIMMEYVEVE